MIVFRSEKIWRWLTNFWTIVYLAYLYVDFFTMNRYSFLVVPMSFLYLGILGLYVGTKEFDRWYERHKGEHPGELFIALWTIAIFVLFLISVYYEHEFKLAHEAVAVYVAVLSIFAVTQRSKALFHESQKRRAAEEKENETILDA